MTAEEASLVSQINDRVAEVRDAIRRALPGNTSLHEEFRVGEPRAETPASAIEAGRRLSPLAREYRSLLVGRGIDQAKLAHLAGMVATLEKLAAAAPAQHMEPVPPPPAAPAAPAEPAAPAAPAASPGEKRRTRRK